MDREGRWDFWVAIVILAILFFGLFVLPKWCFWFYLVPLAAFWVRYNIIRQRRDEWLLRADLARDGWSGASGCDRGETGICISDGAEHVLIAGQKPDALLQLPHIVRDE